MPTWSKLHSATNDSLTIADLIDKHPDAAILWFMLIADAGVWGRFPAEPRLLKHRIVGLSERLTSAVVAEQTQVLVDAGLLVAYDDELSGTPAIAIVSHFEHNPTHSWHRLGSPEFGHPPSWVTPDDLATYLEKVALDKYAGKDLRTECTKFLTTPGDYSPGPLPETTPQALPAERVQSPETETEEENDSLPGAPPAAPPAPVSVPKPSRQTLEAQLEALREPLSDQDIALLDEFLHLCAAENKSGTLTLGRRVNVTRDLLCLRDGDGETVGLGAGPWCYGMGAAIRAEAPNRNYVKQAAGSWGKKRASSKPYEEPSSSIGRGDMMTPEEIAAALVPQTEKQRAAGTAALREAGKRLHRRAVPDDTEPENDSEEEAMHRQGLEMEVEQNVE